MSATTTLSKKFQISVPKAVREQQRWEAGQQFVFIPKALGVLMVPVPALEIGRASCRERVYSSV